MAEDKKGKQGLEQGKDKLEKKVSPAEQRARVNDYIAIIFALGTVLLLWILQLMGMY
jgi:hypothetical protein